MGTLGVKVAVGRGVLVGSGVSEGGGGIVAVGAIGVFSGGGGGVGLASGDGAPEGKVHAERISMRRNIIDKFRVFIGFPLTIFFSIKACFFINYLSFILLRKQ
jgi:hypothetical protein